MRSSRSGGLDDDPDDPVIVSGRRATRGHPLTAAQKQANQLISRERAADEHGFADLKNWRILTKVRVNARHATMLLRALLVLTNAEITRGPTITSRRSQATPPCSDESGQRPLDQPLAQLPQTLGGPGVNGVWYDVDRNLGVGIGEIDGLRVLVQR